MIRNDVKLITKIGNFPFPYLLSTKICLFYTHILNCTIFIIHFSITTLQYSYCLIKWPFPDRIYIFLRAGSILTLTQVCETFIT